MMPPSLGEEVTLKTQLLFLHVKFIIHQKVARCGIQDHNCPTIESMESFCVTVVSVSKLLSD